MNSWKTTASGVLAIVIALATAGKALLDGQPVDWTITGTALAAGVGLLAARDNTTTSEEAGAK